MTPFGQSVARELQGALVPVETASIIDHKYLRPAISALLNNALFYVVPTPRIDKARAEALARAATLAETIRRVGVQPRGIALEVDLARSDAIVSMEALIDAVADAEPTFVARYLGIA